jgi:NADH-quinone oxidoreductase subunit H
VERKVIAHIQVRPGPYRVGPHGLFQPIADVIKLMTKEDLIPPYVNKPLYLAAPFIAMTMALLSIAVIPFGPTIEVAGYRTWMQLTDLNIGVLFVLAVSSMGVYGIALAGWSSNNKYALLGGLRSSAQMISYELPLALALAAPLLLVNTLDFRQIVESQGGFWLGFFPKWNVFAGPFPQIVSFVIFLIASFAETNRVPFDLPEAESELVAGFHTEYSSLTFAAFFMSEYANMVTVCCVATVLFLGGWQPLWPAAYGSDYVPAVLHFAAAAALFYHGAQALKTRMWDRFSFPVFGFVFLVLGGLFLVPVLQPVLIPLFWFLAKAGLLVFLFIWIRGTLPRFRYDQLMRFAWTFLFPVAVVNLLVTGLLVALTSK